MKRVSLRDMTVDQLVERFTEFALAQDRALLGENITRVNQLFDLIEDVKSELKGREGDQREQWELRTHYGSDKRDVAKAVIHEWQSGGEWTPEPWTGLWFGLPWCYSPDRKEVDQLDPHSGTGNREIRIVTPSEFERIRIKLVGGARRIEEDPRYDGVWYRRQDNSTFGLRLSRMYGLTLDVIRCDDPGVPPGLRLYQG